MSRRQNVTLSDELAKQKTKIAEMEQELAAERERVRKGEEEEARAREAAEVQRRAAAALQQQARENRPRVELPWRSASPVVSRSGASGTLSQCVSSSHSTVSHGVSANNCCSVRHVNAASNWRSRASPAAESGARSPQGAVFACGPVSECGPLYECGGVAGGGARGCSDGRGRDGPSDGGARGARQ